MDKEMSDLIERLRNGTGSPSIDHWTPWHQWANDITEEAANALEAKNRRITELEIECRCESARANSNFKNHQDTLRELKIRTDLLRRALPMLSGAVAGVLAAEVRDADELLRALRLDPERYRTEGGAINMPKVRAALANPDEYPMMPPSD